MKKIFVGFLATIGGLVLFSVLALTFGLGYSIGSFPAIPQNTVLTLNLKGPLSESNSETGFSSFLSGSSLSLRDLVDTLDQAAQDSRIKGVLFRVDHAGLGLAQTQEILLALKRFRRTGKFAFAHADTFGEMTPGTLPYYLASGFDEIALQPYGGLNFVGLGTDIPFARNLLDTVGIKPQFGHRQEYKGALETYTEKTISDPNREATQALLDSLMTQIRQDVAQERDLKENDVLQLLNEALILDAHKAKELGFVDHVHYLDEFETYTLSKAGDESTFMRLPKYLLATSHEKSEASQDLPEETAKIAVIYGIGEVSRTHSKHASPFMGERIFGTEETLYAFQQVFKDNTVKAIVLRINTPGGSPAASETIWRLIQQARSKGLPVVVSMGDLAASGGYWLATAADKIVAHPGTITGSIGVVGGKMSLSDLWERLGLNWVSVYSGSPNTLLASPHHDFTDGQWQQLNAFLDYTYDYFIKRVIEGRNLRPEHVSEIAKGRVWSGSDALKFGLVDALGGMNKAIDIAKDLAKIDPEVPVNITDFPRNKTMGERLLDILQLKSAFDDIEISAPSNALGSVFQDIQDFLADFNRAPLSIRHPYKNFMKS